MCIAIYSLTSDEFPFELQLFTEITADHLCVCVCVQYKKERDGAVTASESAYEASHMLQEQLSLTTRERDLAQSKVCVCLCPQKIPSKVPIYG